jgi:hypothetical protein
VSKQELLDFLAPYARIRHLKKKAARKANRIKKVKQQQALAEGVTLNALDLINNRTRRFLENGAQEGDRHHELKLAMLDLHFNGADIMQIEALVKPAADISGIGDRGDLEGLVNWFERNK